jgi:arylsulfatase A-like enzyme
VTEQPGFAWNHGDFAPDINRTWLGLAGPGIQKLGITDQIWSDHTDIRPTMLTLLGLRDDYTHDGRALFELANPTALPQALRYHEGYRKPFSVSLLTGVSVPQ